MGNRRRLAVRYVASVRNIVTAERKGSADTQLGLVLTFVAGAVNAGGFLAVGQYTSHMSGIVSSMADNFALSTFGLVLAGLAALLPFMAGAGCSAILINWGRRHHMESQFALPLLLETFLLFSFGVLGWYLYPSPNLSLAAIPLLCFIMGLQNATVTKISGARMRTTHITGIVTDIGIELGKLIYWNRDPAAPHYVRADRGKLRLLSLLLASFFIGGVVGAWGYSGIGFLFSVPLASLLLALAGPPLLTDRSRRRYLNRMRQRKE